MSTNGRVTDPYGIVFANGGHWNDSSELDSPTYAADTKSCDIDADPSSTVKAIEYHERVTLGIIGSHGLDSKLTLYQAVAISVRDRIAEKWNCTEELYSKKNAKRVYYLSLEFLIGRSLQNSIFNLGLQDDYSKSVKQLGYDLEDIAEEERDPALGNGGLGRLAACFMDSLTTLNYPAWGYGIRYKYGMFEQRVVNDRQVEAPDYWLSQGNPWEFPRRNVQYPVRFYGQVDSYSDGKSTRYSWNGGETVMAVAYDTPVTGFRTDNVNTMRLWSSEACEEVDLAGFNCGHHVAAFESRCRAEAITSVLYPNDNHEEGKELRLKQQFFFVSATLQDIVHQFKLTGKPLSEFHAMVAVQLNDTHPTIAIPELTRLLVDEEGMNWEQAWDIVVRTFGYTNHTIMPEALERWSVPLFERLLPRHLQIIYEINHRHLQEVAVKWPGDLDRLTRMSVIEESNPKAVRMAVLATVGSHCVNGVAKIHTRLLQARLFPDFLEHLPHKFQNKTNGVSPRRWMLVANPQLTQLISQWLGTDRWLTQPEVLENLCLHAGSPVLQAEWRSAKQAAKARLAKHILKVCAVQVSPQALFDIHVKRIHEYKRQFLNILGCIHRYHTIKVSSKAERSLIVPRVTIFAGKAAAGYHLAKCVIHLINAVANQINNDPDVGDLFKVVFIPNYNVSSAELIIPASDLSQHISTAGMEASGTSNMKFAMNGGLILGTMDGANIEIADAIGQNRMFIFGASAEETESLRHSLKYRQPVFDDRLRNVLQMIDDGKFGESADFQAIVGSLRQNDHFLIAHDWSSYLEAQHLAESVYLQPEIWLEHSIISAAMVSRFSSDKTIQEYALNIWSLKPIPMKLSW